VSPILFYLLALVGMGWQLPQVKGAGQRRGTILWLMAWVVALALGTLYFYGGNAAWLADWRLA
jgi:hypothetical protein